MSTYIRINKNLENNNVIESTNSTDKLMITKL